MQSLFRGLHKLLLINYKIKLKLKILYIAIILSFLTLPVYSQGVTLDNTGGRINNGGTIRLKAGQVKNLNDTMGGRFEFLGKIAATQQGVPNIVFNQLVIKYPSKKIVLDEKKDNNGVPFSLIVMDSLIIDDTSQLTTQWIGLDPNDIIAQKAVKNNAQYTGPKDIILQNEVISQDLLGKGYYSNLNLDNPLGADIKGGGGFQVGYRLKLTRGELRNTNDNNFIMMDSSLIVRNVSASIANSPVFAGKVSVRYVGNGNVMSGPEIPDDSSTLLNLYVENSGGLTLTKNVTVNDTLFLSSSIYTEPDDINRFVLTHASPMNPIFASFNAEIDGSIRRTIIYYDSTAMMFNNRYTYALFRDATSADGVKEITFRVKPRTYPPFMTSMNKVERFLTIMALDANRDSVKFGVDMQVGYGWRDIAQDPTVDETHGLNVPRLVLQRLVNQRWIDIKSSQVPQTDVANGWSFSYATNVTALGDFAIGMPGDIFNVVLNARVFLEGPYRNGSMRNDITAKQLVPLTPPNIYPYNLDPKRTSYVVTKIPDSVVDWIVLEFRRKLISNKPMYVTGFLRQDGRIVDLDGKSPILLNSGNVDSGDFFVSIKHRNHLAIITENPIPIYPDIPEASIDFTNPQILFGRANAVKPLGYDNGSLLFGMIAGDINQDGVINDIDYELTWKARDIEGYFLGDFNMNGIITTKDLNVTWNNRNRSSLVP